MGLLDSHPPMRYPVPYATLNAFVFADVDHKFKGKGYVGGNGAGIVIEDDLEPAVVALLESEPDARMKIASFIGLSETAFIRLPPTTYKGNWRIGADPELPYHIRYFTPTEEVPLCGHATVAAVWYLRDRSYAFAPEVLISTGAGELRVKLEPGDAGRVFLTQSPPDFSRPPLPIINTFM